MEIKLHYQEKGEGEPMILLHGNGEEGSYFAHQMDYFSRNYRVIVVDTRGHGKSPRGTASFTIAQFAKDLQLLHQRFRSFHHNLTAQQVRFRRLLQISRMIRKKHLRL